MSETCCKVGSAIDYYDIPVPEDARNLDGYLVARWTGAGNYTPVGYRTLTDWFNQRLLRTTYLENGRSATEARIESEYAALTSEDNLRCKEVIADLQEDGIDGEALADALVSRSTMSRHLRECLGAEKPSPGGSTGDWERQKVEFGREVFREGVAESLQALANKGRLPGADQAEIELPVQLACPDCATRVRLRTALQRGYICEDHLGWREEEGVSPSTDR